MSKYLGAFLVISFLIAGAILVYSINDVKSPDDPMSKDLTNLSQVGGKVPSSTPQQMMEDVKELKIEDLTTGEGEEVKEGDTVEVDYIGTLLNGVKFDSSIDRGETFEFTVGQGQVIEGWEKGLIGMKVGGKRRLTIPSSLGYGPSGVEGAIPPNATLVFEIDLISIK